MSDIRLYCRSIAEVLSALCNIRQGLDAAVLDMKQLKDDVENGIKHAEQLVKAMGCE